MLGITWWDWGALLVYLVGITIIGVWTGRKVKDREDFFIGGRRFGKVFMIFFAFGSGTNGNQAVTVASKTFTSGISGIWYQWLWLFATPFYWLIAPVFRRMRALTTGDYFQYRYGGGTDGLYTVVGVLQLTVNIGTMLFGSAAVIEAISGGAIGREVAVVVMTILFLAYGMAGGLAAAIVTDFIQGILTVLLSFLVLPFALRAVGGFSGLHDKISDDAMLSLVAPGEINGFHIFILALNALVGIVTQPHIMGVCAAGRNEMDGRVGFAGGNLLKRVCTVAWMLTGLCAVVMYMNDPNMTGDEAYGRVAADLLPDIAHGLVGIFIAALLASVMSSCDAFMVSSSGLFTQNLYRRYLAPAKSESHYVTVGRLASIAIVIGALAFAFSFDDVPSALETFWKIQAMMGAAFWVGLFWRRATAAGAWAGTLGAFLVMIITGTGAFNDWASGARTLGEGDTSATIAAQYEIGMPALEALNGPEALLGLKPGDRVLVAEPALPAFMLWDHRFRTSWQMFSYLLVGFSLCILVSLVTPRQKQELLDQVFHCLHTPVQPDEPHGEPFTLPEGLEPAAPRKLIDHPDLEIPRPTAEGMSGFIFFWFCVAAMIAFVYWMAGWGA